MGKIIKQKLGEFSLVLVLVTIIIAVFPIVKILIAKADDQIKIFPGAYSGSWQNLKAVLTQDLGPTAGFEEFNKDNSAYVVLTSNSQNAVGLNKNKPIAEKINFLILGDLAEEVTTTANLDATTETATMTGEAITEEATTTDETNQGVSSEMTTATESAATATENISTATEELVTTTEQIATTTEKAATTGENIINSTDTAVTSGTTSEEKQNYATNSQEESIILSDFSLPNSNDFGIEKIKNLKLVISLAGRGQKDNQLFIDYFHQNSWHNIQELSIENEISNKLNGGYFNYNLFDFNNWDELKDVKVRIKLAGTNDGEKNSEVYLDSAWLEVNFLPEVKKEELKPISDKKIFKANEEPELKFQHSKKNKTGFLAMIGQALGILNQENNVQINAKIINPDGDILEINPDSILDNNGEISVKLKKPRDFKPGNYKIILAVNDNGEIQELEQDFDWGVLAINANKSIYLSGESAYLQMAALGEDGHTLCDANLKLEINNPGSETKIFSTYDGTIQKSGECNGNNVTDKPDYFVYYQNQGAGVYKLKLTNLDNGYEIEDSFEVWPSVPFEIERIGPTRIYPPATYTMKLKIKVNQDFNGQINETVPDYFSINNQSSDFQIIPDEQNNSNIIQWQVDWKAGEAHDLEYSFKAPNVSPYLYLLGPLEIGDFKEIREWQIAADAWYNAGWSYRKQLTIDSTQVSGTSSLSNFPVLVSYTDANLKVVANGGHVQNANGYDIIFTDGTGTTKLDHEIETYSSSTGQIVMWVRMPTLATSTDTNFYIYYGNSSIATSQENAVGVWDSNYIAVWHLKESPAGTAPQFKDSTGHGCNGTAYNMVATRDSTTTQIDGGLSFNGTTTNESVPITSASSSVKGLTQYTVSAWVKINVLNGLKHQIYEESIGTAGNSRLKFGLDVSNKFVLSGRDTDAATLKNWILTTTVIATNTWYYAVAVYDSVTDVNHFMINGTDNTYATTAAAIATSTPFNPPAIGSRPTSSNDEYWPGLIDELRISKTYRPVGWSKTEYNNQLNQGTGAGKFIKTLGSEESQTLTVTQVSLNGGSNISTLIEGSTTSISVVATATDPNGYTDISTTTGVIYRSSVSGGPSCTPNDNNCYQKSLCATSTCSGNSCQVTCTFYLWFITDPTDIGTYAADTWVAWIKAITQSNASTSATNSSQTVDVITMRALDVTPNIPYGNVLPGNNTTNTITVVNNGGNSAMNLWLSGTNMTSGGNSITSTNQQYSTSTFSYGSGTALLNATSSVQLNLSKPTSHPSTSTASIYWGLGVPIGTPVGIYTGQNSFTAVP